MHFLDDADKNFALDGNPGPYLSTICMMGGAANSAGKKRGDTSALRDQMANGVSSVVSQTTADSLTQSLLDQLSSTVLQVSKT